MKYKKGEKVIVKENFNVDTTIFYDVLKTIKESPIITIKDVYEDLYTCEENLLYYTDDMIKEIAL